MEKKMTKQKKQKKVARKKITIKKIVRKPSKKTRGVMAIIPYKDIAKPEMYKGKYTLVPTALNETQIKAIIAPTPANVIKQRPGKGGSGNWDFVPGWWFKKKLNFVFGFSHDFEILGERVDGDFITVKGKLTVKDPKTGNTIATKSDYGGSAVKYLKGKPHTPANYLDIANDFKAAATDAFKRCAVQLGFAMDVYGKSESLNEGIIVRNGHDEMPNVEEGALEPTQPKDNFDTGYECHECADPITKAEYDFSKKIFKRPLCRKCQKIIKDQQGK